ncbi:hypothetical protein PO124_02770 [Bacillus licheniformis]|nr:hypothetical protein [Bacillus licheniformis]
MNNGILTDFTTPPLNPRQRYHAFLYHAGCAIHLEKNGVINKELESRNASILYLAPLKTVSPKAYSTETKAYTYDHEVNLIDQLYAAWHLPPKDQKPLY